MNKKEQAYNLIRKVTPHECHWLKRTYEVGEIVFEYYGNTVGCIGKKGTPFTTVPNSITFFELPNDAVSNL